MVALDAWAVIALLHGDRAAPRLRDAIKQERAVVSWINLGEVLYNEARRVGRERALSAIADFRQTVVAEEPDAELVAEAALIRAEGRLSYADSFAVATAERHDAPLMTGDPEILALARELELIDPR